MTPEQLRNIIDSIGITQGEMARRMGVNRRTICKWLAGEREMSGLAVKLAIRIKADAMGEKI